MTVSRRKSEPTEWWPKLGDAVRALIEEKGVPAKWVAVQVGHDPSTISKIQSGNQPTTLDQVARIALALGVTRREILARADYLESIDEMTLDLDRLSPGNRAVVLATFTAALAYEASQHKVRALEGGLHAGDEDADSSS